MQLLFFLRIQGLKYRSPILDDLFTVKMHYSMRTKKPGGWVVGWLGGWLVGHGCSAWRGTLSFSAF